MKKKEKIELYRLIEPKFKENYVNGIERINKDFTKFGISKEQIDEFIKIFLINGVRINIEDFEKYGFTENNLEIVKENYINGIIPTKIDFEKYGLTEKDLEEFMNLYLGHWNHYLFWKDELDQIPEDGLIMPPDSSFYNFGVPNIDIHELKLLLHWRHSIIIIEKSTGYVTATWEGGGEISSNGSGLENQQIDDYIIIEIKNYDDFFIDLEKGNIKKILSVKLFEKRYYSVPTNFDIYQVQEIIDLYFIASFLKSEPTILVYEEGKFWWMFEHLAEFVRTAEEELGFSNKAIVFKVINPKKIYTELINGNLEILSEIKKIENIIK